MTSFDYRETANHKELTNYAVALFVGMMDVPTVPSGGGGGTSNDLPWGQKGDEDEMERARRCAPCRRQETWEETEIYNQKIDSPIHNK